VVRVRAPTRSLSAPDSAASPVTGTLCSLSTCNP
jgi:hypothetical protein